MGSFFVMSIRFDKCSASDFGLTLKDVNLIQMTIRSGLKHLYMILVGERKRIL